MDNNELKNLSEPQMFNFYFANNGKILILISENNLIFNTELKKYTHPTSLVLIKYDQKILILKIFI